MRRLAVLAEEYATGSKDPSHAIFSSLFNRMKRLPEGKLSLAMDKTSEPKTQRRVAHFWRNEDGSTTIETVIWLPIFMLLLGLIINVAMVFFNESQITRIVQDGNRAFSLGRLEDPKAVEDYIAERLAYLEATLTINSGRTGGVITTTLSTPATDLMPFKFMTTAFDSVRVGIRAQHIIEF
ncbi:TadE/TadG family type IV pilus assembly protein [Sulfitobacter aestuarii]|uniref:TadE/TadG family type IV pilus assembly protein n=1 Tax=Sulfitobacter aestuarii TaxID=2161676 RepID=A0ABW5U6E9_9RHOB